jgi:WhiB family redox-sensing transcriptional regulator
MAQWVEVTLWIETHEADVTDPELLPTFPFLEWHRKAACLGWPERLFFGAEDPEVRPPITMNEIKQARRVCNTCPVYDNCLVHALTKREEFGIWAGTTGRTRKRIWNLVDTGQQTLDQVLENYRSGRRTQYEKMTAPEGVQ